MKLHPLKIAVSTVAVMLVAYACVKPPIGPKHPPGEVGGDTPTECNYSTKGTIEQCHMNPSLWFINEPAQYYAPVGANRLFYPVNLSNTYKQNGNRVGFTYTLLNDSTPINCSGCGNAPTLYARKIQICTMWIDTFQIIAMKPVIYLYPQKETKVNVQLNFKGRLTVTYPDYSDKLNGWEVIAQKDGSLKNLADNTEHQYLFWEGSPSTPYAFNMREGFCVKGSETKEFLKTMLPKLGLTPKEYNDMIVFWLPKMMNNNYNLIHFAAESYTQSAPLKISPAPDNLIRVFMAYQPSKTAVNMKEQVLPTPVRKGFTVVEWGGTELQEQSGNNNVL